MNTMPALNTINDIEDFLTSGKANEDVINIWSNLQESFDNDVERITTFKRIMSKRFWQYVVDRWKAETGFECHGKFKHCYG